MSVKELVVAGCQIAAGLARLHKSGIIYQDIHLGNMMCSQDGAQWKLIDLGSAARKSVNDVANVIDAKDCQ